MHRDHGPLRVLSLTLALTTSRPTDHACLHRGDRLIWVLLPVEPFDLCRLEESHVTAAAAPFALAAHPPVFAYATAATVLALAALPPVLAEAAAATVLAPAAVPPVLADGATAALLALGAQPSVFADATAAALFALAALPPVLADATTAALLAPAALPPVLALLLSHFHVGKDGSTTLSALRTPTARRARRVVQNNRTVCARAPIETCAAHQKNRMTPLMNIF